MNLLLASHEYMFLTRILPATITIKQHYSERWITWRCNNNEL